MDTEELRITLLHMITSNSSNERTATVMTEIVNNLLSTEEAIAGTVRSFTAVDQLPEELWCLYYRGRDQYYGISTRDEPSVRCFVVTTKRLVADLFVEAAYRGPQNNFTPTAVTFDEIKDITRERRVDALLLMDDPNDIKICYVK